MRGTMTNSVGRTRERSSKSVDRSLDAAKQARPPLGERPEQHPPAHHVTQRQVVEHDGGPRRLAGHEVDPELPDQTLGVHGPLGGAGTSRGVDQRAQRVGRRPVGNSGERRQRPSPLDDRRQRVQGHCPALRREPGARGFQLFLVGGGLGPVADDDDPAQRGGVRRNLERDVQLVDVHHEQARSGLLDDGGQVCRWSTRLQGDGHRAGADASQVRHGVLGARGPEEGDEVAGAQRLFGVVPPLGGHRTDPLPEFAVGERVEPLQKAQRGAARLRVGDLLSGTLAQGGAVGVCLHHGGHQVGER